MSGWSNQAVSLIILTEETTGQSGIFGYSPAPGAGNLFFSVSATAGTDTYGNAYPAGISGLGSLIVYGASASILVYEGTPAAGSLIGSWSAMAGTDAYGNAYPMGLGVGLPTWNQVFVLPQSGNTVTITSALTGILGAVVQAWSPDTSQVIPGVFGSLTMASNGTSKMSTLVSSPLGASAGAAMVLEAENDAGTDTSEITFGTTTTPDDSTIVFSPILTISPYALILYSGESGQTQVTIKTPGSGTIPIPAGVTTAKAECWGAGGGGHCGIIYPTTGNGGEYGGAGGEYACEPALAVTSGGTVAYTVGAGSAGTAPGQGTPGNGGNSLLTGSSATVTGHGATITGNLPIGGTGYAGTIHYNGGNGGTNPHANSPTGNYNGGAGAGSSAGTTAAGRAGANTSSDAGASGGSAPAGGGSGGKGGGTGTSGTNGADGSAPGGGGGGGWANTVAATSGGDGAAGQVRLTYSTGAPTVLFSVALTAFTDQFGTAIPAGVTTRDIYAITPGAATQEAWHYIGGTGQPAFGTGISNRGSPWVPLAYRKLASPANSIEIRGWFAVAAVADTTLFTLPAGWRPATNTSTIVGYGDGQAIQFNVSATGLVGNASNFPATGNYYLWGIVSLDQ